MNKKEFKTGEIICQEGSEGREMFLVLSGKVRAYITVNSKQIQLSQFKPGEFFGEMALFFGDRRTATVEALEKSVIQILDRESMLAKFKTDPQFGFKAVETLARRQKEAHKVITNLGGEVKSLQIMYGSSGS